MTLTKTDLANMARSLNIRMKPNEDCTVSLLERRIKAALKENDMVSQSKCVKASTKKEKKEKEKEKEEVKEENKRQPTVYNLFVKTEIEKLKKLNPNQNHRDRFKEVVRRWNQKKQ